MKNKNYGYFIGVDPGVNGGIALIDDLGVNFFACPKNELKMPFVIMELLNETYIVAEAGIAYVEKQWQRPGMSSSSMTRMITNYGMWIGALTALGIEVAFVAPQTWMKHYKDKHNLMLSSTSKKDRKHQIRVYAAQLYPCMKDQITLKTSDAILIARYGLEINNNVTDN